jgi:hypothetical protein
MCPARLAADGVGGDSDDDDTRAARSRRILKALDRLVRAQHLDAADVRELARQATIRADALDQQAGTSARPSLGGANDEPTGNDELPGTKR